MDGLLVLPYCNLYVVDMDEILYLEWEGRVESVKSSWKEKRSQLELPNNTTAE